MPFQFPDGSEILKASELQNDPQFLVLSPESQEIAKTRWLKEVHRIGKANYSNWSNDLAGEIGGELLGIGKPVGLMKQAGMVAQEAIRPILNAPAEANKALDRAAASVVSAQGVDALRDEALIAQSRGRRPSIRRGNQRGSLPDNWLELRQQGEADVIPSPERTIGDTMVNSPAVAQLAAARERNAQIGPIWEEGRFLESPLGNISSVAGQSLAELGAETGGTFLLPGVGLPAAVAGTVGLELDHTYAQKLEEKAQELNMRPDDLARAISEGNPAALQLHYEILADAKRRAAVIGGATAGAGAVIGKLGARLSGGKAGASAVRELEKAALESGGNAGARSGRNIAQNLANLATGGMIQTDRDAIRAAAGAAARAGKSAPSRALDYTGRRLAQAGTEGTLEGLGEGAGQLAAGDKKLNWKEMGLEAAGGWPVTLAHMTSEAAGTGIQSERGRALANTLRERVGMTRLDNIDTAVGPDATAPAAPSEVQLAGLDGLAATHGLKIARDKGIQASANTQEVGRANDGGIVTVQIGQGVAVDNTPLFYSVTGPQADVEAFLAEARSAQQETATAPVEPTPAPAAPETVAPAAEAPPAPPAKPQFIPPSTWGSSVVAPFAKASAEENARLVEQNRALRKAAGEADPVAAMQERIDGIADQIGEVISKSANPEAFTKMMKPTLEKVVRAYETGNVRLAEDAFMAIRKEARRFKGNLSTGKSQQPSNPRRATNQQNRMAEAQLRREEQRRQREDAEVMRQLEAEELATRKRREEEDRQAMAELEAEEAQRKAKATPPVAVEPAPPVAETAPEAKAPEEVTPSALPSVGTETVPPLQETAPAQAQTSADEQTAPATLVKATAKTEGAETKINTRDNSYEISAPGAKILGYVRGTDFPGKKASPTRGEIFIVEVSPSMRRTGTGTSLVRDALRLMKANGATTVKVTAPSKDGRAFFGELQSRGIVGERIGIAEGSGTAEFAIPNAIPEESSVDKFIRDDKKQKAGGLVRQQEESADAVYSTAVRTAQAKMREELAAANVPAAEPAPASRPRRPGKGKKAAETASVTKEEPKAQATDIQRGDTISVVIPRMDEPLITEVWEVKDVNGVPHGFFDWYGMKNKPLSEMKLVRKSVQRETRERREAEAAEQRKANTVATAIAEVKREMAPTSDNRRKPADIKKELIQKIEAAIADLAKAGEDAPPTVTIKIPGDGTFTIKNTAETLANALKKAKAVKTTATSPPPRLKTLAEYSRGLPTEEEFAAQDRLKEEAERVKAENEAARKRAYEDDLPVDAPKSPAPAPRRPKNLRRRYHTVNPLLVPVVGAQAVSDAVAAKYKIVKAELREAKASLINLAVEAKKPGELADRLFTPVHNRLFALSPDAYRVLTKTFGEADRAALRYTHGMAPFLRGVKAKVKNPVHRQALKAAGLNGNFADGLAIAKEYGLEKEFKDICITVAEVTQDMLNSNLEVHDLSQVRDAAGKLLMMDDFRDENDMVDVPGWTVAKINSIKRGDAVRVYFTRIVENYVEAQKFYGRLGEGATELDGAYEHFLKEKIKKYKDEQARLFAMDNALDFKAFMMTRIQEYQMLNPGKVISKSRGAFLEKKAMADFAIEEGAEFTQPSLNELRNQLALTDEEKIRVINQEINGGGEHTVTASGNIFSPRVVHNITGKQIDLYADPFEATLNSARRMAETVAKRRLFGMDRLGSVATSDDAIQAVILRLNDTKNLTDRQREKLIFLTKLALENKAPQSALFSIYRGLETMTVLGQMHSTLSQLDDAVFGMGIYGIGNMGDAYARAMLLGDRGLEITRKDSPHSDKTLAEMRNTELSHGKIAHWVDSAVDRQLALTLFRYVDISGKTALQNAALRKYRSEAVSGKISPHFRNMLEAGFLPAERELLLKTLRESPNINAVKDANANVLIQQMIYLDLMDLQAIGSLNMTEQYLRGGAVSRIFYLFRSFGLNRIGLLRKRIFDEKLSGAERAKAATSILFWGIAARVPVELIRGTMSGRVRDWEDIAEQWKYHLLTMFLSQFMLSRYTLHKAQQEGIVAGLVAAMTPSHALSNAVWMDTGKGIDAAMTSGEEFNPLNPLEAETVRRFPLGVFPGPWALANTAMRVAFENYGKGDRQYQKRRQQTLDDAEAASRLPAFDYLGDPLATNGITKAWGLWDETGTNYYGRNIKVGMEDGKPVYAITPPSDKYTVDGNKYRMTPEEYQEFLRRSGEKLAVYLRNVGMEHKEFLVTDAGKAKISLSRSRTLDRMKKDGSLSFTDGKAKIPPSVMQRFFGSSD